MAVFVDNSTGIPDNTALNYIHHESERKNVKLLENSLNHSSRYAWSQNA